MGAERMTARHTMFLLASLRVGRAQYGSILYVAVEARNNLKLRCPIIAWLNTTRYLFNTTADPDFHYQYSRLRLVVFYTTSSKEATENPQLPG